MSVTKTKNIDFRNIDIITGVNTAGVIYLWYKLSSMGSDLNKKILKITQVLNLLQNNINVVDMQLKSHIYETNLNPIHNNQNDDLFEENSLLEDDFKNQVLERIKSLEDRLSVYETINNPLVSKYSSNKKNISPVFPTEKNEEKTPVIW